jgi:hypothetical protein
MPRRIKTILILTGLFLFLSGCSTVKIPSKYRYSAQQVKREITGSWIHIKLNLAAYTDQETELSGELIAIQSDTVYVITPHGFKGVQIAKIDEADLYMFMNQPGLIAAVTGLLYLPDLIASVVFDMPGFLILGVPWIITGSIITIAEGSNHSNILNFPSFCSLEELNKFARFPQGMPPDIDKTRIHLLTDN